MFGRLLVGAHSLAHGARDNVAGHGVALKRGFFAVSASRNGLEKTGNVARHGADFLAPRAYRNASGLGKRGFSMVSASRSGFGETPYGVAMNERPWVGFGASRNAFGLSWGSSRELSMVSASQNELGKVGLRRHLWEAKVGPNMIQFRSVAGGSGGGATPRKSDGSEIEWRQVRNSQGRVYYLNSKTGERSWDRPENEEVLTIEEVEIMERHQREDMSSHATDKSMLSWVISKFYGFVDLMWKSYWIGMVFAMFWLLYELYKHYYAPTEKK